MLSESDVDMILIERSAEMKATEFFSYLLDCFQSTMQEERKDDPELTSLFYRCITTQVGLLLLDEPLHFTEWLFDSSSSSSISFPQQLLVTLSNQFSDNIKQVETPLWSNTDPT